MIGKLSGLVDHTEREIALIDVNGVGYVVHCSTRTLSRLPPSGGAASLLVETAVKEDRIVLYGFGDVAERDWFRLLTTVQGVGAKSAMAILSVLSPDEVARAIAASDKAAIVRAEGVGQLLAARVLHELKDKVPQFAPVPAKDGKGDGRASGASADAVSALVNLGYGRSEAFGAVAHAVEQLGNKATVEALVRAGLKELAS
jgi:holliday junction DNA helicase RuvA